MATKIYTKEYAGQLQDIFESNSKFLRSFGGEIQTILGAEYNNKFLELKISDTETVIQEYDTDPNVAFGTGTGNSNRFGPRREVKSVDEQVEFDTPLSIHEGVDNFTVNDVPEEIVAEKLANGASAWTNHYNQLLGDMLADNASKTLDGELTEAGVIEVFNKANAAFINNGVSQLITWIAYVKPEVYNIIVDSKLTTTLKNADVNVGANTIVEFKGFQIEVVPSSQMKASVYFAPENVGVVGVAIQVARAIDSEDFNGVAIQSAGKLGRYIPKANKSAIVVANLTEVAETPEG